MNHSINLYGKAVQHTECIPLELFEYDGFLIFIYSAAVAVIVSAWLETVAQQTVRAPYLRARSVSIH